ncbi:MAG TPA: hypothetical protein VIL48_19855 [Acidimicrobiales bacterium]
MAGDRRTTLRPIPRPGGTPGWPPEQPPFGLDGSGRTGSWARRLAVAVAAVVVAGGAALAVVLALA